MNIYNEKLIHELNNLNYDDDERYVIEYSKDNKKVIKIFKDRKTIYIGSKYNVERDIDKFKNSLNNINADTTIIVWGLGTGEHINCLLSQISYNNKIIIVEPDEKILYENIKTKNIKKMLEDNRIFILNYKKEYITNILESIINESEINNIEILSYGNYDKIYSNEFDEFWKEFRKFMDNSIISLNTELYFSRQYFNCYINNVKKIINSSSINNFKNKFAGMPAIVVSAGPSLQKNIHLLKDVQDKFIIISGGRTLRTLLDFGVTPDIVCVIDPGDPSYMVMEKTLDSKVPLLFSEATNYRVVDEYVGDKIFFNDISFKNITNKFLEYEIDGFIQGGSVAHICTELAVYFGCSNVIFIGQDLAYTNKRYHAEIAKTEGFECISEDETQIYIDDIYGNKVATSEVFNFYRQKLEYIISQYIDVKFINSTEGGANIKGTLVKDLSESISEFAFKTNINKNMDSELKNKPFKKDIIIKNTKSFLITFKELINLCNKAFENSDRMYKYYTGKSNIDINNVLSSLEKLDKRLNKNLEKVDIIKKLYAPLLSVILMSDEFKIKNKDSELEKGKKIALKNKTLYEGLQKIIHEAETEFIKLLDDLNSLEE